MFVPGACCEARQLKKIETERNEYRAIAALLIGRLPQHLHGCRVPFHDQDEVDCNCGLQKAIDKFQELEREK